VDDVGGALSTSAEVHSPLVEPQILIDVTAGERVDYTNSDSHDYQQTNTEFVEGYDYYSQQATISDITPQQNYDAYYQISNGNYQSQQQYSDQQNYEQYSSAYNDYTYPSSSHHNDVSATEHVYSAQNDSTQMLDYHQNHINNTSQDYGTQQDYATSNYYDYQPEIGAENSPYKDYGDYYPGNEQLFSEENPVYHSHGSEQFSEAHSSQAAESEYSAQNQYASALQNSESCSNHLYYDQNQEYYQTDPSYSQYDYSNYYDILNVYQQPTEGQDSVYGDSYYTQYHNFSSEPESNANMYNVSSAESANNYDSTYDTKLSYPNSSFYTSGSAAPLYDTATVGVAESETNLQQHVNLHQEFATENEVPEEDPKPNRHLQVWEKFFQNAFAMREAVDEEAERNQSQFEQTLNRVSRSSARHLADDNSNPKITATNKLVDFRSDKARYYFVLTTASPTSPNSSGSDNSPWPALISNRKYLSLVSFVEMNVNVAVRDVSLLYFAVVASILQRDTHHMETLLLLAGAHVRNVRDEFGRHVLHYAAYVGDVSILALLLDSLVTDMDINEFDGSFHFTDGTARLSKHHRPMHCDTPLLVAVKHNHVGIVQFLIESAVDVRKTDAYGWTALQWAQYLRHQDCENILAEAESATPLAHVENSSFQHSVPEEVSISVDTHRTEATNKIAASTKHDPRPLSETNTMSMTRMIDQFLLSATTNDAETSVSTPATPAGVSSYSVPSQVQTQPMPREMNSNPNRHAKNENHDPDLTLETIAKPFAVNNDTATNNHYSTNTNNNNNSSNGNNHRSKKSFNEPSSGTNEHTSNSAADLYKPLSRPKEVDDLIRGFQAKDKARRSSSVASNAANLMNEINSVPFDNSHAQSTATHKTASARHSRSNTSSKSRVSPSQHHFYDISSDSSESEHKQDKGSGNSGSKMADSPRVGSTLAPHYANNSPSTSKVSRKSSAPTTQGLQSLQSPLYSQPQMVSHTNHLALKRHRHHSDADDEQDEDDDVGFDAGNDKKMSSMHNQFTDDAEEETIVVEEVIPSIAERFSIRLWSMLWYLLHLSLLLILNRPTTHRKEEDDEEVEYENDVDAALDDEDSNFLYNQQAGSKPRSSLQSSASKSKSGTGAAEYTTNIVKSFFRSQPTSTTGNSFQQSSSHSNKSKIRLSQPPSNVVDDLNQQHRALAASVAPPKDSELEGLSSPFLSPSLPPPTLSSSAARYVDQGAHTASRDAADHTQSAPRSSSMTPRQPPPEVQVAIALSRQQQQQNSFSLGDRLPQGVAWRYVNVLHDNDHNKNNAEINNSSATSGAASSTVENTNGAALRQRKPKIY
jgi:hypothetical protein